MKRRNLKKAVVFVIVGCIFSLVSMFLAGFIWFSGSFLPVYVAGKYVIGNQILRYEIYAVLLVGFFAGLAYVDKGLDYLIKSLKRRFGR